MWYWRDVISVQWSERQTEKNSIKSEYTTDVATKYLKLFKCLIIQLVTRMNWLTIFLLSLSIIYKTTAKPTGLEESMGKEPVELYSSLTFWKDIEGRSGGFNTSGIPPFMFFS